MVIRWPSTGPTTVSSISAFVAPKTENLVSGGGLCRIRRMSALRSTRQDAQINYLSTLSIFMKQTTYLATLPNSKSEVNKCVYDGAVRDINGLDELPTFVSLVGWLI